MFAPTLAGHLAAIGDVVIADVTDFDSGLRLLRSPSKVNAVMARRRANERLGSANYNPPPDNGGTPAAIRLAA